MKNTRILVLILLLVLAGCGQQKGQIIKTKVPARPAGQQDMLQFAADPIPDVGIGVVGLGMRGTHAVKRLLKVPGCHVAALCDIEPDRVEESMARLGRRGLKANGYSGDEYAYKELCQDPSVDLVYICTD